MLNTPRMYYNHGDEFGYMIIDKFKSTVKGWSTDFGDICKNLEMSIVEKLRIFSLERRYDSISEYNKENWDARFNGIDIIFYKVEDIDPRFATCEIIKKNNYPHITFTISNRHRSCGKLWSTYTNCYGLYVNVFEKFNILREYELYRCCLKNMSDNDLDREYYAITNTYHKFWHNKRKRLTCRLLYQKRIKLNICEC